MLSLRLQNRSYISDCYAHPLKRNQHLAPCCMIVSWLPFLCFSVLTLAYLLIVWICPLELREGLGGWNLSPLNKKQWNWKLLTCVQLFVTSCTVAHHPFLALLSMEFSRQEYWNRLPFPSPGDLPNLGTEPKSPAVEADSLLSESKLYLIKQETENISLLYRESLIESRLVSFALVKNWNHVL